MTKQNLGYRLKDAREKRGLTQEQLIPLVPNATQQSLSALESRNSKTLELLFGYADALSINPRWLQTGEGDSWLDKQPPASDPLLQKLIERYGQLSPPRQREVASFANFKYAEENPEQGLQDDYPANQPPVPPTAHEPEHQRKHRR